jgi:hypothetical protein
MANTTNFGWETPDDTDLVKDGAAAIRTLGQAIDTSMQDLEGGTTGQILAKNSNTDMDFVWVTNDVGDITEVVAGTGLSGGGSSGSVTLTNTVATEFDAKGDLVVGTGADTFDKLTAGTNETRLVAASGETTGLKYVADTTNYAIAAKGDLLVGTAADTLAALTVGTNGHTLVADSAEATGLKWVAPGGASGLTLIKTDSFTTVTSVSLDNVFSATYEYYRVLIQVTASTGSSIHLNWRARVSGSDNTSSGNYFWASYGSVNTGAGESGPQGSGASATSGRLALIETGAIYCDATFYNPFSASIKTGYTSTSNNEGSGSTRIYLANGNMSVTTSYTGLTLLPTSGTISGKVSVYGYSI